MAGPVLEVRKNRYNWPLLLNALATHMKMQRIQEAFLKVPAAFEAVARAEAFFVFNNHLVREPLKRVLAETIVPEGHELMHRYGDEVLRDWVFPCLPDGSTP